MAAPARPAPRTEDLTIQQPSRPTPSSNGASRRHRRAILPVALLGLALLGLAAGGCQTTAQSTRPMNSDDVDTSVTLPRTLENVWYRADEPPADLINYAAEGTLVVSEDAVVFSSSQMSLTIGVRDIRQVVWRKLQGDRENEWAVVYFRDGGVEKIAGFAAADRYVFHTSNKELYSAIVKATRGVGTSPR